MRRIRASVAFPLLMAVLLALAPPAMAQAPLPPELEPWVPWVLAEHPEQDCAITSGGRACTWPSSLRIALRPGGALFELWVTTDTEALVPLPGGQGRWPQDVLTDDRALVVEDIAGVPTVRLPRGQHRIHGRFVWQLVPQTMPVPTTVAELRLALDGAQELRPTIDEEGLIRLGPGASTPAAEERLDLEVSRHITDGVPLRVSSRITLRASGAAREVDLGAVGLPGTQHVRLEADLPARVTAEGHLVVQVRAGTFTVELESLHEGPVTSLAPPGLAAPWPEQEYWAVATDDQVRAVELSGPPAVDPARTPLPDEWRGLPTYLASASTPLAFTELRRGEPEPAPNRLSLDREIWLDADGGGFTFRDTFTGDVHQAWKLAMLTPYELGHAVEGGRDLVITEAEGGRPGVALRSTNLRLVAESRVEDRQAVLPAVGWATDVTSLQAVLHLAPGWRLLAASGVDRVPGSLLHDWDLFDLFYVLILTLAAGRLLGWRWAAVALLGLALSRQHSAAPAWGWVFLLLCVGLHRWVPEGWPRRVAQGLRWTVGVLLMIILVPFAVDQVRTGLFPVLEHPWQSSVPDVGAFTIEPGDAPEYSRRDETFGEGAGAYGGFDDLAQQAAPEPVQRGGYDGKAAGIGDLLGSSGLSRSGGPKAKKAPERYLSLQYDPTSVATTGPGVQQWNWNPSVHDSYDYAGRPTFGGDPVLEWSGPVASDHQIRLFLLGPRANGALNILRVVLLLALGLRMTGLRSLRVPRGLGAAAALVGAVLLVPSAQAAPDAAILEELEQRLTATPSCAPDCASTSELAFSVRGDTLVVEAEVHAAAPTSWPLPGPARAWVPSAVTVDGEPGAPLARLDDGFIHVRLEPGVHRLRAEGGLAADSATLTLGLAPKRVAVGPAGLGDWTLDGPHPDGTCERSVQLTRTLPTEDGAAAEADGDNLAPWLEVRRTLDLGIPWRVLTEVERVGGSDAALSIQVPVLEGEAVTDETLQVEGGRVRVSLDANRSLVSWVSTLEHRELIALTAPEGVPWTERWTMSCSPVFDCATTGIDPIVHSQDGAWSPRWLPWPGERVDITVRRPEAVPGQTVTIDQARLDWTPGRRLGEGQLRMVLRTSQGGQQAVTLPTGAKLQQVTIDGRERPLQLREGKVWLPLQPGAQSVLLSWQQPHEPALFSQVPDVDLGSPAVNVGVVMHAPAERCILAVTGPGWGPVPLFWTYVLVVLAAAPLLARLPWTPLKTWHWLLLGLGMTQVPIICPALVAGWFVLVGFRRQRAPKAWWAFDLTQLGVIFGTAVALICLYASIHAGLLLQPDMQIEGNGSSATELMWFADRIDGALPTPAVVSIPMWTWRVAMLLWALWLAASLLKWLPWAWRSFRQDRWYAMPPAPRKGHATGSRVEPAAPAAKPEPSGRDPDPEAPPPMPTDPTEAP